MISTRMLSTLVAGMLLATVGSATTDCRAQAAPRASFDFEEGEPGFTAISFNGSQVATDAGASVTLTREKDQVKSGAGSLSYSYKIEPKVFRGLTAVTRLPAGTQSARFWVKSTTQTVLMLALREADGSSYRHTFHVPAHEWVQVTGNLDEFTLADGTDENRKLDLDQVNAAIFTDFAGLLVSLNEEVAKAFPQLVGPRQLWLDDLQFTAERVPQATGIVQAGGSSAYLVDNFETGVVHWLPVRAVFVNTPSFELFPQNTTLKVLPEAAAPGAGKMPLEPGGKGLRFTYQRAEKEAFALARSLENVDLARADRLRLSLNVSRKSMLVVQVKEKDDSEYQSLIMPDDSTGWRSLDLALTDFRLSDNSKDENGMLDPGQIKDLTILDASALLALPGGETTLELDAVSFTLK